MQSSFYRTINYLIDLALITKIGYRLELNDYYS